MTNATTTLDTLAKALIHCGHCGHGTYLHRAYSHGCVDCDCTLSAREAEASAALRWFSNELQRDDLAQEFRLGWIDADNRGERGGRVKAGLRRLAAALLRGGDAA